MARAAGEPAGLWADGAIGRGGWFTVPAAWPRSVVAATAKSIVIDFVRHGQTPGNAAMLIDTRVPDPTHRAGPATGAGEGAMKNEPHSLCLVVTVGDEHKHLNH